VSPSATTLGIELRHLRTFVATAEELSFTRAAERLQLAQQAVSNQIRQLEDRLGVKLFDRSTRHVALTDAGERLLAAAGPALDRADRAVAAALSPSDDEPLRLALAGTGALDLTPRLVRGFAESRPATRLDIRFGGHVATDAIVSGSVDAALVRLPAGERGLDHLPLFEERRLVALPADHPLAGESVIRISELADEHWIAPDAEDAWASSWLPVPAPDFVTRAVSFDETIELVRMGVGVGLVPASLAGSRPGVVFRPVAGVAPSVVALVWRSDDDRPALKALVETARAAAAEPVSPTAPLRAVPSEPQREAARLVPVAA
jgi:DNA-binding transcriptional LysR family regulator